MTKNLKSKIEELEQKVKAQDEEIKRLNKKAKRSSFWLFWLLSRKENNKKD